MTNITKFVCKVARFKRLIYLIGLNQNQNLVQFGLFVHSNILGIFCSFSQSQNNQLWKQEVTTALAAVTQIKMSERDNKSTCWSSVHVVSFFVFTSMLNKINRICDLMTYFIRTN